MEPTDLTTGILIEIRDEVRTTHERVDHLSSRVDHLSSRVDTLSDRVEFVNDDLGRRIVESERRTATAIHELGGTLREVHTLLKDRALHDRVTRCEREIDDLKHRLG
jgi:uncharacterized protein Yka (UPF0111/DUF47 family)